MRTKNALKNSDVKSENQKSLPLKLAHLLNSEEARSRTASPTLKDSDNGLMTPLLSELMSPHSVKLEDHDVDAQAIADLAQTDLLRGSYELRFPDVPLEEIVQVLRRTKFSIGFTAPEMKLIVLEWYRLQLINHQMLEHELFMRDRRLVHGKIAILEDLYGQKRSELSEEVIAAFEVCHDLELYLLLDIQAILPDVKPATIAQLIADHFPHKTLWLLRESHYVHDSVARMITAEEIQKNLPFRPAKEVKTRVNNALRKLQRLSATPVPVTLTPEELARQKIVHAFIEEDMTSYGLKHSSQKQTELLLADEVREAIKSMGGSEKVAFTKLETEIVRIGLKANTPSSQLVDLLPFRTEKEITEKMKKLEIACVRRKKFANDVERLIYEAQWYALMADESGGRRSRRSKRKEVELEDLRKQALVKKKKVVKELLPEELEEKKRLQALRAQKRAEVARKKEEEKEALKRKRQLTVPARYRRTRGAVKEKSMKVNALIEEAKWFQSVTGDGTEVKTGEKRKRKQAYHLVPEFQNRQQLKSAQKRLMEKKQKIGKRRGRRPNLSDSELETESSGDELGELQDEVDSDEESSVEVSPYDPTSILEDTPVPLNGRQLFNDSVAECSLKPSPVKFSDDVNAMLQEGTTVPINNTVAAKVIRDHLKAYKSLPPSFPPIETADATGELQPNSRNIIHVRYLLYPQHTEQFILAAPKLNELDPIFELQKVFEIHYALYFSHSEVIRDIIYEEFCSKLSAAVQNDSFADFMKVIDKWNLLMLELTPYAIEIDPAIDINGSLREYLPESYRFEPSVLELMLDTFYFEVLNTVDILSPGAVNTSFSGPLYLPGKVVTHKLPPPERFFTRYRHLRPTTYPQALIALLNKMTELSRFAVQQLLLRAYIRIVSPDSRKLRYYKAFTAEVYGELLPSFVSEVLSKVGLKPEDKFYDLGSGVGNTTFQAALEFGVRDSGGCEVMEHASKLTALQENFMQKQLIALGLKPLNLSFALNQSFVENEEVRKKCVDCNILIVNNYLFDFPLNVEVGKLLYGLKPGLKIISLRNFIPPRYKAGKEKTIFDYLKVEKFEMSDYLSVSWTANKVPYYISTVESTIRLEYL